MAAVQKSTKERWHHLETVTHALMSQGIYISIFSSTLKRPVSNISNNVVLTGMLHHYIASVANI